MDPIHFYTLGYLTEYLMVGIIFGIIIGLYALFRVYFSINDFKLSKNKKIIISSIIAILAFVNMLNIWSNVAVFTFYLFLASLLADIIRLIWKYLFKDNFLKTIPGLHKKGILALVFFAIILIHGFYGMNHIDMTEYNLTTDKIGNESYSILFISDVHYDTIQNPELVKESISKINELKPDIVVLGGDIVDEGTSKDSMKEVFKEFGSINSTYGVYYVYGNHDRQPYVTDYENENRTFTDKELNQAITSSGIKILKDKKAIIDDNIVLVGRDDLGWNHDFKRANVSDMLDESDYSKYIVVLDHQPIDKDVDLGNGIDLQLSGHTHAGQVFPFKFFQELTNIYTYGLYMHHSMVQIVSSGLAGWGWPIRNEGKCEYVLVNIN
ncbi:metallophosphoesterase [uncultured Methanobrevibacter sp.]|uniref:metallophosphoesterase n=1 Tax=uncultured Methanobrevibacter sp. TaxID=253161 RepID=UPI0025EDC863|nr:metallophosphoesterase [uncultured Methanobrevibacter sp.]